MTEAMVALARGIAGVELLLLEGVGHQAPPRSTWDVVVPAILRHTDRQLRSGNASGAVGHLEDGRRSL